MTRWGSAMPLEPAGRPGKPLKARYWSRGSVDMPDGVFSPEIIARNLGGDLAREAHRHQTTQPEAGKVVTLAGTEVPRDEIRERERLFAAVRTGDRRAAADAAEELWQKHGAWIVTCPRQKDVSS